MNKNTKREIAFNGLGILLIVLIVTWWGTNPGYTIIGVFTLMYLIGIEARLCELVNKKED